jgi:hypothetical protein
MFSNLTVENELLFSENYDITCNVLNCFEVKSWGEGGTD